MRLNPQQHAAMTYVDGPLLVLAGAGSGKTAVITRKIAHLIQRLEYLPEKIAAITFTNKAAREMKQRVGKLLGRQAEGLTVCTFHALGLRFLHEESHRLGYRRGFSIFDPQDGYALLKGILPDILERDSIELIQWQISGWKSGGLLPEQALERARSPLDRVAAEGYRDYVNKLKKFNAFDFDDLILWPSQLLATETEVASKWQQRFRHLLVDEYQDTNAAQYRMLKGLLGERASLTAVGDDDQSIYGWRGAQPENLALLKHDYPQLKVVKLEQNYRSARIILKAANGLIANNPHLFEKALWSELGEGDPIRVMPCDGDEHEAEKIVGEIQYQRFTKKSSYRDFAILYRSNHQARVIEQTLRSHRMPYQMSGGPSFFDRSEVKDLLAYVRLVANPRDDGAFLRVINTPTRGIGSSSVERIAEYAASHNLALVTAAGRGAALAQLTPKAAQAVRRFDQWLGQWQQVSVPDLISRIMIDTDYLDWLKRQSKDAMQAERRIRAAEDLASWWRKLAQAMDGEGIDKIVQKIALASDEREEDADDAIALMTLHAAKGLEFPHVFMIGVEEGTLPHRSSLDEGTVEEERRLMYVGMTRAQRSLTLTFAKKRRRRGEVQRGEPSRFIDEIPAELLVWPGDDSQRDEAESRDRGRAHLANLKALLGD